MARNYPVPQYSFGEAFMRALLERRGDEGRVAGKGLDAYRMQALKEQIRAQRKDDSTEDTD